MGKKNWLQLIKRFIFPEVDEQQEHKNIKKKRKWLLFPRLKSRRRPASMLAAPVPRLECDAEEAHLSLRAHDVPVSPADVVVVDFLSSSGSVDLVDGKISESSDVEVQVLCSDENKISHIEDLAAMKIQTSFRGYLARKALRALKGLVRLQAIVRGRAVRRRAITTLRCLQSIVSIQSQVCAKRCQMVQENVVQHDQDDRLIKIGESSKGRSDGRLLTKDDTSSMLLTKKDAMFMRERAKAHSFNHRSSTESEDEKTGARLSYWLEKHVNAQMARKEEIRRMETRGKKHLKLRNLQRQNLNDDHEDNDPPLSFSQQRLFHHKKRRSVGEDNLFPNSPNFPTYMAATESAKARIRSTSAQSPRPKLHYDAYSDGDSPYKQKLSPMSSVNSEVTMGGCFLGKASCSHNRSNLKGLSVLIRSNSSLKDVSLEPQCSMLD